MGVSLGVERVHLRADLVEFGDRAVDLGPRRERFQISLHRRELAVVGHAAVVGEDQRLVPVGGRAGGQQRIVRVRRDAGARAGVLMHTERELRARIVDPVGAVDAHVEVAAVVPDVGVDALAGGARVVRDCDQALHLSSGVVLGVRIRRGGTERRRTERRRTERRRTEGRRAKRGRTERGRTERRRTERRRTENGGAEDRRAERRRTERRRTERRRTERGVCELGRVGLQALR